MQQVELGAELKRGTLARMPLDCGIYGPALLPALAVVVSMESQLEDPLATFVRGEGHVPVHSRRVDRDRTAAGPPRVQAGPVVLYVPLPAGKIAQVKVSREEIAGAREIAAKGP